MDRPRVGRPPHVGCRGDRRPGGVPSGRPADSCVRLVCRARAWFLGRRRRSTAPPARRWRATDDRGARRCPGIGGDTAIQGIGWGMPISDVVLHLRQEFAIHRWDLVGDDDEGDEILARPELIDHSVRILGDPLLGLGSDVIRTPGSRSPRASDLRGNLIWSSRCDPPAPASCWSTTPRLTPMSSATRPPVSSSFGGAGRPQPSVSERHWIRGPSRD